MSAGVVEAGAAALGIELGSTRIKAVMVGPDHAPLASGSHAWENTLADGTWTYPLEEVWSGLQACYESLVEDCEQRHGVRPTTFSALGVSAMMHGYLAFNADDELLVPFRTWRNTSTERAAAELTEVFGYNIPLRWSVAHLYQAMLDDEDHVPQVSRLFTLASYVHWRLTGRHVIGVGDASGMFPIDPESCTYHPDFLDRFDDLAGRQLQGVRLKSLLPEVLVAGQDAGSLTGEGCALLDPTGTLESGIALCPPEGDAGTGMVATNAVAQRTGNVSVGTSIFAMTVLERPLAQVHPELDMVTTPAGDLVAMVHCNNGASELAAWARVFGRFAEVLGHPTDADDVFAALLREALDGEADGGGLMAFNYLSGEPITEMDQGRPLFLRAPDSRLNLANFVRTQLYAAFGTLALGMHVQAAEGVELDVVVAHGGLFRTEGVAQQMLAAALDTSVAVGEGAGEGGAWGIALLAQYVTDGGAKSLSAYLSDEVFTGAETSVTEPDPEDVEGFATFLARFRDGLAVERTAIQAL